jgi:hypothetical protein
LRHTARNARPTSARAWPIGRWGACSTRGALACWTGAGLVGSIALGEIGQAAEVAVEDDGEGSGQGLAIPAGQAPRQGNGSVAIAQDQARLAAGRADGDRPLGAGSIDLDDAAQSGSHLIAVGAAPGGGELCARLRIGRLRERDDCAGEHDTGASPRWHATSLPVACGARASAA